MEYNNNSLERLIVRENLLLHRAIVTAPLLLVYVYISPPIWVSVGDGYHMLHLRMKSVQV